MPSIPIVDFEPCGIHHSFVADVELKAVGDKTYEAFMDYGFVYLKNTGISSTSVDELNEVTEEFFSQPDDVKAKYFRKINNFGYDAIGKEKLVDGHPGDYKESFNMTCGATKNPDIVWPDDVVPEFSKTAKSFMKKCKALALRVLDALSFGLNLENPTLLSTLHSSMLETNNGSSLRCLRYPPILKPLEKDQIRLAEHTDYGSLTLLFQDMVGGLQIKMRDGTYIDAVPIKDAILLNVADLLQYWTNGRLRSTPHRILSPTEESQKLTIRRSVAFFVHPSEDLLVSRTLFNDNLSGNYTKLRGLTYDQLQQLTVGEYLQTQFHDTYA
ncbi:unnamed protein product [Clavelina lepadiformis]|uniref:Fe2OG dioxygenase domain-containing protein n=1 Tax=Clavelina lepadiformis TaxID=159417 RepID=A0ABP0GFD7_CLALP